MIKKIIRTLYKMIFLRIETKYFIIQKITNLYIQKLV